LDALESALLLVTMNLKKPVTWVMMMTTVGLATTVWIEQRVSAPILMVTVASMITLHLLDLDLNLALSSTARTAMPQSYIVTLGLTSMAAGWVTTAYQRRLAIALASATCPVPTMRSGVTMAMIQRDAGKATTACQRVLYVLMPMLDP